MSYKIDPDAKYMMYDKPVYTDNFKLMRDKIEMAIMENEMEIDKLTDEIIEITGCSESALEGFSVIQLQIIKDKIVEGSHYNEIIIDAMRFLNIDINKK